MRVVVPRPKTEQDIEVELGDDDIEFIGEESSDFREEETEENSWYRHLVKNRVIS